MGTTSTNRFEATVERLLAVAGTTYATEAGITVRDTPAPLYRTLVLSILLSARIRASIAVAATRELVAAGMGTARRMLDAQWQERVDALGRGQYARYDESTATALGAGAQLLVEDYSGDLRKLRARADGDVDALRARLRDIPKLGPVGAHIFCREAQQVWPELRPYIDRKAASGAAKLGLPTDPAALAALVDDADLARFAAALVRVTLEKNVYAELARHVPTDNGTHH